VERGVVQVNSEADSIVWIEEGASTRVGFDSRPPENEICFWDFFYASNQIYGLILRPVF
jgi:hypothetical protein